MQLDASSRACKLRQREPVSLVRTMSEALQLVSAKLVGPSVFLTCNVRDLQAHVVARGPCGKILQEVAQRLCGCEKLVGACFCSGVVASTWQAEFPVFGCEAVLGHHSQGQLRERLKACNECLRIFCELGIMPAYFCHAPLLREPAEV